MYPLAETTKDTHGIAEKYFIRKYNTDNPNYGYNVTRGGSLVGKIGRKMNPDDKKLRSDKVIAVHMNDKKLIIADSMKLFGDYVGTSKDMIKNAVRKGMPYKGWFIFYTDAEKRKYILINNVINDQDKRTQDRHSEKAKTFYTELCNSISGYLSLDKSSDEYFPKFNILPNLEY